MPPDLDTRPLRGSPSADAEVIERLLTEPLGPGERLHLEVFSLSEPARARLHELRAANSFASEPVALSLLRDELTDGRG